jgi:hypothetical protein
MSHLAPDARMATTSAWGTHPAAAPPLRCPSAWIGCGSRLQRVVALVGSRQRLSTLIANLLILASWQEFLPFRLSKISPRNIT